LFGNQLNFANSGCQVANCDLAFVES
jgi:hypothetical protein